MGWWSAAILGGDEPLDKVWDFEAVLGIGDLYPARNWDEEKRKKIVRAIAGYPRKFEETMSNSQVHKQIGGLLIMESGAIMTDRMRELALDGGMHDCDAWCEYASAERNKTLNDFLAKVRDYKDGVVTTLEEKTLADSLCTAMEEPQNEER